MREAVGSSRIRRRTSLKKCLGDLDHLLVRAREIADRFVRIEIETELGKQAFGAPTHLGRRAEIRKRVISRPRKDSAPR